MRWTGWFLLMIAVMVAQALGEAHAQSHEAVLDRSICAPDGVSLGGYDPVSYWQATGPLMGQANWTVEHDGATYRFHSETNQTQFSASPEQYLPRYRGWCAATLAMGNLACPDYTNYKIEDGELFLFEVIGFTNGRDVWNSDPLLHKQNADDHFIDFLNE